MSEYVTFDQLREELRKKPDLVEVVRCRDCKFYRFVDRSGIFKDEQHNDSFCSRFVDGKRMEVEQDGFCAWGEVVKP